MTTTTARWPVGAMLLGGIAGAVLITQAGFTTTLAVLAAVFALVTTGFAVFRERP